MELESKPNASSFHCPKVYLAGAINGRSDDEATTWREWFKKSIALKDVCFLDPMKRDYRGKETENYREIVELDKLDIKNSDIVILMFVQPSVGTSMEAFYAWTLGKPIITIDESKSPLSPWLRYHSTTIVRSKKAALSKLESWLD